MGLGLGVACAVLSGVMMLCDSAAVEEKFSRMTAITRLRSTKAQKTWQEGKCATARL